MNRTQSFLSGLAYTVGTTRSIDALQETEGVGEEVLKSLRQRGLERFADDPRSVPQMCMASVHETLRTLSLTPDRIDTVVLASSNADDMVHDDDETALFAALNAAGFVRARLIGLSLQACSASGDALDIAANIVATGATPRRVLVIVMAQRKKMGRLGPQGNSVFSDGAVSCIISSERSGFEICASEGVTNVWLGSMGRAGNLAQFQGGLMELRDLTRRVLDRSGVAPTGFRAIFGTNAGVGHLKLMAQATGVPLDRTYDDDVPRFGHLQSCDSLVSLKNYVDENALVAGDCFLLLSWSPHVFSASVLRFVN